MRLFIAIVTIFLTVAASADGATKSYNSISQCLELNDTAKIFECFGEVDQYEEKLINSVYNQIMELLKTRNQGERANLLKQAEIAWIKFRDNECEFHVSIEPLGEAKGAAKAICQIQETQNRRRALQGMLQDEINR